MHTHTQQKSRLREQLRAKRRSLSTHERDSAAKKIAKHALELPQWAQVNKVAIYSASDGEADPQPLARLALEAGKQLYLPVIQADQTLLFARWQPGDNLIKNTFGIGEPAQQIKRITAAAIDLICLPLVGWSIDGTRLGMGGGYYDRTLTSAPDAVRMGLGYRCQNFGNIPREQWDVCLHWVATETGLHHCASSMVAT